MDDFLTTASATPNRLAEAESLRKTIQDKIQVINQYDAEIELLLDDDDQLSQDIELSTQFHHNASVTVARLSALLTTIKGHQKPRGTLHVHLQTMGASIQASWNSRNFNFRRLRVLIRTAWALPIFSEHLSTPTTNYRTLRNWTIWKLGSKEKQPSWIAQLRSLIITTKSLGNFCTNTMKTKGALYKHIYRQFGLKAHWSLNPQPVWENYLKQQTRTSEPWRSWDNHWSTGMQIRKDGSGVTQAVAAGPSRNRPPHIEIAFKVPRHSKPCNRDWWL